MVPFASLKRCSETVPGLRPIVNGHYQAVAQPGARPAAGVFFVDGLRVLEQIFEYLDGKTIFQNDKTFYLLHCDRLKSMPAQGDTGR